MYFRQREVCFSSGRYATNLAETTDGVGWVDYPFFRLVVAIGMQHITRMLIKTVKGKGSEHTKAYQPNYSCLWLDRVHFRSRRKYINKEIRLAKNFFFLLISEKRLTYICCSASRYIFRLG